MSPGEPRLRAGWRLILQVLLQIALSLICGFAIFIPYSLLVGIKDLSGLPFLAFNEVIEVITISASVYLARRILDKRSFASLGFKVDGQSIADVMLGIGITFVIMGSIFITESLLGWLTLNAFAWSVEPVQNIVTQLLLFFVVFVVVAWNEELMSRGYHLQTIASGSNLWWGLIFSSAIFGLLHLGNPHATWISAAGIFFAGLFLGFAYVRTRQLWLPIGLHIGWNFFEGVIFGFPVSGLDIYHLVRTTVSGPVLWTGGDFGPEAGLIVLPAIAAGVGLVYICTRLRTKT